MRTILYTTRNISTIEYDPTVPCLIDTVTEFLYSEEFRRHMDKGLELLIEKKQVHGDIGWLANTKSLVAVPDDDTRWIAEDWCVRAAEAGIRYIAMVLPDDEIVRMSNDFFDKDFEISAASGLTLKHFADLESACGWLRYSLTKS